MNRAFRELRQLGSLIREGYDPMDVAIIATRVAKGMPAGDLAYLLGPVLRAEDRPPKWLMKQARVERYRIVAGDLPGQPCTAEELVLALGARRRLDLFDARTAEVLLWAREVAERHRRGERCRWLENREDVVGRQGRSNDVYLEHAWIVRNSVEDAGRLDVGKLTCSGGGTTTGLQ